MDITRVKEIYGEMASIDLVVDFQVMPNPQYICEKLGECHVNIGAIEKLTIEVSQEIAVTQQALNNSIAEYETKKEQTLSQDEHIKSLPNIKDREATVNSYLKTERATIRNYENSLTILTGVYKNLSLKNKNLNRANTDLKAQIKLMEAQIRLGAPAANDPAARSLMEEMKKSISNKDAFQGAVAREVAEEIVDPTASLDINNLLAQGNDGLSFADIITERLKAEEAKAEVEQEAEQEADQDAEDADEEVSQELVDPTPELNPAAYGESSEETTEEDETLSGDDDPFEGLDEVATEEVAQKEEALTDVSIDLDQIIDQTKGGTAQKIEQVIAVDQKKEDRGAPSSTFDLDALIDDLNIT